MHRLTAKKISLIFDVVFILLLTIFLHKLFSPYGLNPSDDGVVLSNTKRFLFNESPHKDFIQIRPIGSNIFWYPLVFVFTKFNIPGVILAGRFIFWLQLIIIAWTWVLTINKFTIKTKHFFLYPLVIISVLLSSHNFPPMPWTTIDGLFFLSIGIYLFFSKNKSLKFIGFLCLGFLPWIRQSFAIVPLVLWLFLDKKNKIRSFGPLLLPSGIILIYFLSQNAVSDMLFQLTSRSEIYKVGILTYIKQFKGLYPLWKTGVYFWLFFLIITFIKNKKIKSNIFWFLTFSSIYFLTIKTQINNPKNISFFIFYILISLIPLLIIKKNKNIFFIYILLIIITWSTSISLGYNTPVLFIGNTLIFIYLFIMTYFNKKIYKYLFITNLLILIMISPYYKNYRDNHMYRDLPKKNLTFNLGEIYPALTGIYSNKNMFEYFTNLKSNYQKYKINNQTKIALAPSNAIFWLLISDPNPLNIDWVQNAEYPTDNLRNMVLNNINSNTDILMINKYEVKLIAQKNTNIDLDLYNVLKNIESTFTKIDETNYFYIYSKL